MATNIQYVPWDNTQLANFKSWGQAPGNALTAFGWSKVGTVNGMVNWSTQAWTPFTANQGSSANGAVTGSPTLQFSNAWSTGAVLTLTSVANASGGTTVYTGTITGGGSNAFAGNRFTVAGFTTGANNGTFVCTASTTTTLTLNNSAGVAETHAATATLTYAIGDVVTNNNGTWICTAAYTPTTASPAPPYEWLTTGTIHWALYAFEVWQSPGSPTIYMRLEFVGGQGGAIVGQGGIPRMRVAVGTSIDTNGNLNSGTGNVWGLVDMMSQTNPTFATTFGQQFPCYFSGDTGGNRLAMLMWPDVGDSPSTTGAGFFCIERSLTNTGSYYTTPSGVGFVQGKTGTYSTATSQSQTFTNNVVSGNLLVAFISNGGTNAGTITISDTRGTSWTAFYSDTTANGLVQKAWFGVAPSSGANTVTVSWSTGSQNSSLIVAEYQGIAASPLDQNPATKTGTSAWSTNSVTTTQAVELAIAVTIETSAGVTTNGPFTQRFTHASGASLFGALSDVVLTQTQTLNGSGGGSGNYAANIVTFKASPNTPPVTPYWTMFWWGANSTAATAGTGVSFAMLQLPGSNSWITTQADNRIWTVSSQGNHSQPPDQQGVFSMSGLGNQSVPAFPVWPLVGWVGNPLTAVMSTKITDGPNYTTFTIPLYGTTHTFLNIARNPSFWGFGSQGLANSNGLAMRFD